MKKNSPLTYKDLLKNNIPFRNLFFALSISILDDWFYSVAPCTRYTFSITISDTIVASPPASLVGALAE